VETDEKTTPDGGLKGFLGEKIQRMAKKINREDIQAMLRTFRQKFKRIKDPLKRHPKYGVFIRQCELIYEILRAWIVGEYDMPWKMAAALGAALIYVLNPFDLIPDFIPFAGFVDDMVVVSLCMKLVKKELGDFCEKKGYSKEKYGLE